MSTDFEAKLNRVPVSVVIPCYRCADTIERAMESVMAQTVAPTEVRLVEDGSGDDGRTLAMLYIIRQDWLKLQVLSGRLARQFGKTP